MKIYECLSKRQPLAVFVQNLLAEALQDTEFLNFETRIKLIQEIKK